LGGFILKCFKQKWLYLILSLIIIFTLGCNNKDVKDVDQEVPTIVEDISYNGFVEALNSKGYEVKELDEAEFRSSMPFFSVGEKLIQANNHRIFIYEFLDAETAEAEAKTISKDASKIGSYLFSWHDTPNFYNSGKLIVGYIGQASELRADLEAILHKPITD
jgi:hypothetical protein